MNRPTQTVPIICPQCQATLTVPTKSVGTTITCSECLEDFKAQAAAKPTLKRASSPTSPGTPTSAPVDGDEALQRLLNPNSDGSSPSRETIRLDDDSAEETYPTTKKKHVLERNYEFSVVCMICGTRLDVNDALIGKKIKCPDCHNAIDIRTPSTDHRRKPLQVETSATDDDDFGLSKVVDTAATSSPYHSIANELLAKAEAEVASQAPATPRPKRAPALDALERAEQATTEIDEQERPKLPAAPFRTGMMKFLLDPQTIARLVILAIVFFVVLAAIQAAIESAATDDAQSHFLSVLFRMFAITIGAVFATNLAVSLLGILQDTANGKDAIESWPDVNFLDWIGEAFYVFSGLFIAAFPACVLAKVLSLLGASDELFWLIAIGGSSLGILFLFPFALVSMLESGSAIMPVSQPILRSLRLARGSWVVFTFLSGLVLGAGLCLGAVRVLWRDHTLMNFVIALLWVVAFAIYFRLLGRLVWCCDEAVLAEDIRLEEAAEAGESRD